MGFRGGVKLTPPQRILVFKYPSGDRVKGPTSTLWDPLARYGTQLRNVIEIAMLIFFPKKVNSAAKTRRGVDRIYIFVGEKKIISFSLYLMMKSYASYCYL